MSLRRYDDFVPQYHDRGEGDEGKRECVPEDRAGGKAAY
jgi:hypothetical protein